jgi:hypothetical protein
MFRYMITKKQHYTKLFINFFKTNLTHLQHINNSHFRTNSKYQHNILHKLTGVEEEIIIG